MENKALKLAIASVKIEENYLDTVKALEQQLETVLSFIKSKKLEDEYVEFWINKVLG